MYSLSDLRRGISNPNLFFREANRVVYRILNDSEYNGNGVDIFGEDWDNLIILDACRYDLFETNSRLEGTLESRESRGSNTYEFLKANFSGKDLHDTVYVTANPQYTWHRDDLDTELHAVVDVWKEEGWDEEYQTVLPETTTEYAKNAAEKYPDKRLVIHYIQPHYPFLGSDADVDKGHFDDVEGPGFWYEVMTGEVDIGPEEAWELYRENLEITLPYVEELIEALEGKTVVTSDHGNMIGERSRPFPVREWGHPHGIYTQKLVKIPWLIHDTGSRRKIVAEEPESKQEYVDDEQVKDRLRQLGYKE